MSQTCETIKIMPSHKSQGDFVEINKTDFDKAIHKLYEDEAPKGAAKAEVVTEPVTPKATGKGKGAAKA